MIEEFFLDIYNRTFILCFDMPKEEVDARLSARLGVPVDLDISNADGVTDKIVGQDVTAIIIYIASRDVNDIKNLGTMVHETVHAANYVFEICGIELDRDNDEPHSYLVSWIFRQVLGALHGYNAK